MNFRPRLSAWCTHIYNQIARRLIRNSYNPLPDDAEIAEQIIQASASGMLLVDARQPDMPIVYANAAFERSTGYRLAEVAGQNPRFLHGDDTDQPDLDRLREALARHQSCGAILRNYRKDGTLFWNELRITPVRNPAGEVTHFLGIQNDITDRKQAADALARSEARYRQMFEGNRAVKLLINPDDGRIVDANPAAVAFYGYSLKKLKSMRIQDINMLPEAIIATELARAQAQERTYFEFQHRLVSGAIRDVDVFSSPVHDGDQTLLFSIVVDVTGKREANARREQLLSNLHFLNRSALELIDLPDEDAIYTYMGEQLHRLLDGNAVILINQLSPDGQRFSIQGAYGVDETLLGRVSQMLGYSPVGATYEADPLVQPFFRRGHLVRYEGGLPELARRVVPVAVSRQLVRLFDLGDVYMTGLQKDGRMYAGVQIYLRGAQTIEHPDLIEAFVQQASTALQRIQAMQSLRASDMRYRSLFEQTNDAVFILDLQGNHRAVNRRAAGMLGYTPEEIIGLSYRDIVMPDQQHQSSSIMQRLLAGEIIPPYERTFRRKDGTPIPTEINLELVSDGAGQPLHFQSIVRDITERKKMETQLREQFAELDRFFTVALDLLCIANMDGEFIKVNKAWETVLGYSTEELEGHRFLDFVHPDDLPPTLAAIGTLASGEQLLSFTNRYRTHHGDYRYIEWRSHPYGQLIYAAARDITERIQSEAALKNSEANFRNLFNSINDFLFVLDTQGHIQAINDTVTRRLGYTAEELRGQSVLMVHPEGRREEAGRIVAAMLAGQREFCPVPVQARSGEIIPVETYITRGTWNGQPALFGVTKDISPLKLSEEKFATAFQISPAIAGLSDLETGAYVEVNQMFYDTLGFTPDEVIGQKASEVVRMDEDFRQRALAQLHSEGAIHNEESVIYAKDGTPIPVLLSAKIITMQGRRYNFTTAVDITERKRMEAELRASENRFRSFIEYSRDGLVMTDETGRVIGWNPGAVELTGIPTEAALGQYIWDVQHSVGEASLRTPDNMARARSMTLAALETGQAPWLEVPNESIIQRADGTRRIAQAVKFAIQTEDGYRIGSILRDVTADRQMQDAMRTSENRYRMILQGTEAGTWEWHIPSGQTIFNERWAEMIGYKLAELEPISIQTWIDLTHPDDLERANQLLSRHFAGAPDIYEVELRMRHKDGHWVWIMDRGKVLEWLDDGQPLRMFGTHMDITERKAVEDALITSEERLRAMITALPDLIFRIAADGTYLDYHAADPDLLLAPPQAFLGCRIEDVLPPALAQQQMAALRQAIATGEVVIFEFEAAVAGAQRCFEVRFVPAPENEVLSIARDITARQQAQQHELNLLLEKERVHMLTSFVQNAAHEFRTPLASIGTSAYLMTLADDPERRQQKARHIEMHVQRITQLLDMLLLMTRLEDSGSLRQAPVNLTDIVEATCQQTRMTCPRQHELCCALPPDLPLVLGDADYLSDAFKEILHNACRYTPDEGRITVSAGTDDQRVWVAVQDTGPGIPPDALPHIFDTFWRQDTAHSTPGFGLGLTIAQRIIARHAGQIIVNSQVGQGTCFRVYLPGVLPSPSDTEIAKNGVE